MSGMGVPKGVGNRNSLLPRRWGVRCFSCRQGEVVDPALLSWLFDADSDVLGGFELDTVNDVSCLERVLQCGFVCFDGDALVVVWQFGGFHADDDTGLSRLPCDFEFSGGGGFLAVLV